MKKIIFGLIFLSAFLNANYDMITVEDCAEQPSWILRLSNSGAYIATAYLIPSGGVLDDVKFGMYFAAGLEMPCTVMPVVILASAANGADPVALSAGLSLANRCMALTVLHDTFGMEKSKAYSYVVMADWVLGYIPGLGNMKKTKWIGAVGNALENFYGPLQAGVALLGVPFHGEFNEVASSEFSEESGMRLLPAIMGQQHVLRDMPLAVATFGVAHFLAQNHKLKSRWLAAAGVSFMINVLTWMSARAYQKLT